MRYNYDSKPCEHCGQELELRCLKDKAIVEYNFKKGGKNNWLVIISGYVTCISCGKDSDLRIQREGLLLLSNPFE